MNPSECARNRVENSLRPARPEGKYRVRQTKSAYKSGGEQVYPGLRSAALFKLKGETMNDWFYSTAFSIWDEKEIDAIDRVMQSNKFTMGPECAAFEEEFAAFHRMKYGIMVNSGSSANLVAVAALFNLDTMPLRRSYRAVVPAIAWSTTYAPLVQHGMELVLADCDDTWNAPVVDKLDVQLVVGASILGNPGYESEWAEFARKRRAYFIVDNCESLGARIPTDHEDAFWKDGFGLCGTSGIMNTFSFFYSHQISAIEGGMILTNDEECATLCRMLRAHGWSRDIQSPASFDDEYDFRLFGYNVRPLEMHAAIAREQLKKYAFHREQRLANVGLFRRLTEQLPITHQRFRGNPDPFGLSFTVKDQATRQKLVDALRAVSIDCRLPTGGSFRLHKYSKRWQAQKTPNADAIHRTGLFLGNGAIYLSVQIGRAVDVMREVL